MNDTREVANQWLPIAVQLTNNAHEVTSTEAMALGGGCLVKVTTHAGGSLSMSVVFVPDTRIEERHSTDKGGEPILEYRLV